MLSHPLSKRVATVAAICAVAVFAAVGAQATQTQEKKSQPPAARRAVDDLAARTLSPTVAVGPYQSVQVNVDSLGLDIQGDAANEPSLALDPVDSSRIVVGYRQFDSISSDFRQAGYSWSRDGGATWTMGVLEPGVGRSDPVLDVDDRGRIYYYSVEVDTHFADLFRSDDGGQSWLPAVSAYGSDKIWMTVDKSVKGPGNGNVYLTWGVGFTNATPCGASCCDPIVCTGARCCTPLLFLDLERHSRSLDGGETFEAPVPYIPGERIVPATQTLAVGPKGRLYSIGEVFTLPGKDYMFFKSENVMEPGVTPTFTYDATINLGGDMPAGGVPNPGLGQPEIAVDLSDRHTEGNIYILASVIPSATDPLDAMFIRSTDEGATWSTPVRVNDDPTGTGAYQWFATLSVAPNRRIDAVWYDTRNSGGNHQLSELFYSYSYDGGLTWSPNVAVSPQFDSRIGGPQGNSKLGDYIDIVSDRASGAVAYSATFNGGHDAYFVRVFPDCNDNGISDVIDIDNGAQDESKNDIPDECEVDIP